MSGPPEVLRKDPTEVHGWTYWATRDTLAVTALVQLLAIGATILGALLIVAANPNLPLNWGWNTIEHVADPFRSDNYARRRDRHGAVRLVVGTRDARRRPGDPLDRARVPVRSTAETSSMWRQGPRTGRSIRLSLRRVSRSPADRVGAGATPHGWWRLRPRSGGRRTCSRRRMCSLARSMRLESSSPRAGPASRETFSERWVASGGAPGSGNSPTRSPRQT